MLCSSWGSWFWNSPSSRTRLCKGRHPERSQGRGEADVSMFLLLIQRTCDTQNCQVQHINHFLEDRCSLPNLGRSSSHSHWPCSALLFGSPTRRVSCTTTPTEQPQACERLVAASGGTFAVPWWTATSGAMERVFLVLWGKKKVDGLLCLIYE